MLHQILAAESAPSRFWLFARSGHRVAYRVSWDETCPRDVCGFYSFEITGRARSAFSTITAVLGVGLGRSRARSKDNQTLYYSDGNCRVQSGDFGLPGGLRGDPGTAPVGASSRHRNGIMPDAHCSCGAIT